VVQLPPAVPTNSLQLLLNFQAGPTASCPSLPVILILQVAYNEDCLPPEAIRVTQTMRLMPRSSAVPLHRRWIADIIHFGRKAHTVGAELTINVAAVAAARNTRQPPASWVSIWVRAVGLVGRNRPELRTAYLPFPWPRMYVHPSMAVTVMIERQWQGQPAVFAQPIPNVDARTVSEIDDVFVPLKSLPVENVGAFRHIIRISKFPLPLRRMLWSIAHDWSGRLRSKYIGSVAINSLPRTRIRITQIASPCSCLIYFGQVAPNGDMPVQVFWDHRVMDAIEVDRVFREIEAALNSEVAAELGMK
jgi:hypothetical protein